MKTILANKLTRNRSLVTYLREHLVILTVLPGMAELITALAMTVEAIENLIEKFSGNLTGPATVKNFLKGTLTAKGLDVSAKLTALASIKSDLNLKKEVHSTRSTFHKFSDNEMLGFLELLLNRSKQFAEDLVQFDLTDADISEFEKLIISFRETRVEPRNAQSNRARLRQEQDEWFVKADKLVKDIDVIMCMIRIKRPDIYQGYLSARKIVNAGRTKMTLRGKIAESGTKLPVPGVTITLTVSGNGNKPFKKLRSGAKGHFRLHSLPSGTYDYLATRSGYVSKSGVISIPEKETVNVEMELERSEG